MAGGRSSYMNSRIQGKLSTGANISQALCELSLQGTSLQEAPFLTALRSKAWSLKTYC